MTIEIRQERIRTFQRQDHAECLVCGPHSGFELDFHAQEDGSIAAEFELNSAFAGYRDRLHGGVVASILDSAMTNCLASHGVVTVTAELKVRFSAPVAVMRRAEVIASVEEKTSLVYFMKAAIYQEGRLCASASAKFVQKDHPFWTKKRG